MASRKQSKRPSLAENDISNEDEEDQSDGELDWKDPHVREQLKKERSELKSLRTRVAVLEGKLKDKDSLEMEASKLRYKAMEADDLKETLAKVNENLAMRMKERNTLKEKVKEMTVKRNAIDSELNQRNLQIEELKGNIAKLQKELDLEKVLMQGQEKSKVKLNRRIDMLERELKQQKELSRTTLDKFEAEKREVERERAQRLVDVHKLKMFHDEKTEMRRVAEESFLRSEEAVRNERHMKDLIEPLRQAVKRGEILAEEDAESIIKMSDEVCSLKIEKVKLADDIKQRDEEIQTWRAKVELLESQMSSMNTQIFRVLQIRPEVARMLTSNGWGPLVLTQLGKRHAKGRFQAQGNGLPTMQHAEDHSPGREGESRCRTYLARHHLLSPQEEDEPAVKFAALLEEMSQSLHINEERDPLHRPRKLKSVGNSKSSSEIETPEVVRKHFIKLSESAGVLRGGSRFVGHGLSLPKQTLN